MNAVPTYKLLDRFRATFEGTAYRHRSSTLGDKIAGNLYEDLVDLARSRRFVERIDARTHGTNRRNQAVGLPMRRGDGVFGEFVPGVPPKVNSPGRVASAPLATIEVGAETKILAKAMIKQIDRVMSDLRRQAEHFQQRGNPLCVGIVGVNYAEVCTSYEKDRAFRTDGTSGFAHPIQEAEEAERRLREQVVQHFDHFLFLRYVATNEPPFLFHWLRPQETLEEYGALLLRLSIEYEERFP